MTVFAELCAPADAYPLGDTLAEYAGVSVEIERTVPTGGSTHYVWVDGEDHRAFVADVTGEGSTEETASAPANARVVDELPDRTLLRLEWEGEPPSLVRFADEVGGTFEAMRGTPGGWTLRVRFPDAGSLTAFRDACWDRGIETQLHRTYDPESDGGDEHGITAKQADTLAEAFEAGYFDVPRGVTLSELADRVGVSEQAVSERLRRGLSTLLRSAVFGEERAEATGHDADADTRDSMS